MIKNIFFITLYTFMSSSLMATDYLMYIGGGGEKEDKANTIFDISIKNMGAYTKRNPNLKVTASLNGGHPETETIMHNEFSNNTEVASFSTNEYNRLIDSYTNKINQMSPGDQLMIFINSHGAENNDEKIKTHEISSSMGTVKNLNTLSGVELVNLDKLEALKNLAKSKGVKLAIVDASCHSGKTLALADENTCVISATGPHHYAYTTFAQNFANAMVKGRNLEEIFLDVREAETTAATPMISSPIGMAIDSLLYSKISPYLYYDEKEENKLLPFLRDNNDEVNKCVLKENYNSLIDIINKVEELNTFTIQTSWKTKVVEKVDLTNLKTLLTAYHKTLLLGAEKMNALGIKKLDNVEVVEIKGAEVGNFSTKAYVHKFTWKELIQPDYKKLIKEAKESMDNESDHAKKLSYMNVFDFYSAAQDRKEELLLANPNLGENLAKQEEEVTKSLNATRKAAEEIALEERKLYSVLYNDSLRDPATSQHTACQNFKI